MTDINDLFKDDWGYTLEAWQIPAAEAVMIKGCKRNIWKTPRGGRKSTLGDLLVASLCIDNDKTVALITSVGGAQAAEHIRNIKFRIEQSPSFFDTLVEPCNAEELNFWNGSRIISIPQSSTTRVGYHPDVKYADELSRITDLFYYTVFKPMGRGKPFIEINSSTPFGRRGAFYSNFQQWQKSMSTHADRFFAIDVGIDRCPWITPEELEEEKLNMPILMFEQEMLGRFVSPVSAVFAWEYIEAMIRDHYEYLSRPVSGRVYSMGVDFARKRDFTSIAIWDITEKPYRKVYGERFQEDWEAQYSRIRKVWKIFMPTFCIGDSTGVGDPVVQELSDIHMEGYNMGEVFGGKNQKYNLINNMIILAQQKQLLISPSDTNLITELNFFEYKDERMQTMEASKGWDDEIISSGLALSKTVNQQTYEIKTIKQGVFSYDRKGAVGDFYGRISKQVDPDED